MALRSRRPAPGDGDEPAVPPDDGRMSLAEHLRELRSRLIKSVIAVVLCGIIGFALYDPILDQLTDPYCEVLADLAADSPDAVSEGRECTLKAIDPLDGLSIRMKLSAYVGLTLALPVVLWQLWRFITPGLYDNEKRYAVPFVLSATVLFLAGAALAFATFSQALEFLIDIGGQDLEPFYSPARYLSLITFMMLAFGVGFQFPIVLVFLQIANVVNWRQLSGWRRYAVVINFAVAAVITPSGDPFTLMALAIPMVAFYEISILIGRFGLKKP